jgi:hypothetical protein
MKSNVILVKSHTRLQSTDFVVVVPYKIIIHEHDDEKNQIACIRPAFFLFSAFRIPNSEFERFPIPHSFLIVQLQYISPGRYLKAKKGFIQFYIELMVGKLDSIFIAIGVVSNYPDDGKRIFGNG